MLFAPLIPDKMLGSWSSNLFSGQVCKIIHHWYYFLWPFPMRNTKRGVGTQFWLETVACGQTNLLSLLRYRYNSRLLISTGHWRNLCAFRTLAVLKRSCITSTSKSWRSAHSTHICWGRMSQLITSITPCTDSLFSALNHQSSLENRPWPVFFLCCSLMLILQGAGGELSLQCFPQ